MEGSKKSSDPPETDLDYYSKPENYEGSNLTNIKRFNFAKAKEEKAKLDSLKTKKKKKDGFDIFKRYRHILKGYLDADIEPDDPDTSEDEEDTTEESKSKKLKFQENVKTKELIDTQSKDKIEIKSKEVVTDKLRETPISASESPDAETVPKTPETCPDSGYRTEKEDESPTFTPVDLEGGLKIATDRGSSTVRGSVSSRSLLVSKEIRAKTVSKHVLFKPTHWPPVPLAI